jgi:hypothetical protein
LDMKEGFVTKETKKIFKAEKAEKEWFAFL